MTTTQFTVDESGTVIDAAPAARPASKPASAYAAPQTANLVAYREARKEELLREREARLAQVMERAGSPRDHITDEYILCGLLNVDQERYQRRRNEDKVLYIAEHLNWNKFKKITVSRRPDGSLWIIDGQHRVEAVRELLWGPEYAVPCQVMEISDVAEEADIFVDTNTKRTGLSTENKFRAQIAAKRTDALELVAAVGQYGLTIRTSRGGGNKRNVPGEIMSVQMLDAIRKQGGLFALHCVLTTLRQAFGIDPDGYRSAMMEGVWHFLLRYHAAYDPKRLVSVMRVKRPIGVFREAALQQGGNDAIASTRYTGQTMALALHGLYMGQRRVVFALPPFVADSRVFGPMMRSLLADWRKAYGIDPVDAMDKTGLARQATFLRKITQAFPLADLALDPGRSPA